MTPDSNSSRPTRATIDLGAIAENFRLLAERARPAQVYAVVKADAYGHGAVVVARRLEREGANCFGVGVAEEGIELRRAGVRGQILVLGFSDPHDAALYRSYGLTPTLYDLAQARGLAQATAGFASTLSVHLKIDTGMGRLGIARQEIPEAVQVLAGARHLKLTGTSTQLARADETEPMAVDVQLSLFRACLEDLRAAGVDPGVTHCANSAGLLLHPPSIFQAVRPGLALYGIPPSPALPDAGLVPAMEVETRVMSVRDVPEGAALGYGGRFVTRRRSTIAVLPIGYHDGVRRVISGRASVLMRGGRAPIVGAVSMDLTLIDATETGAAAGDRAVLLGREGADRVTAWDLALAADTIPYEIVCGIGARVPRLYRESGAGS
ncbi:MAG TPA: alanine racemase [Thermoanaerobaculia bacterium]|nr:alanine racemase [Thermoanaerobaculia bacterium]